MKDFLEGLSVAALYWRILWLDRRLVGYVAGGFLGGWRLDWQGCPGVAEEGARGLRILIVGGLNRGFVDGSEEVRLGLQWGNAWDDWLEGSLVAWLVAL